MARKIEFYFPPIQEDGYNSDKPMVLGSTLDVAGAATFTGAVAFSGAVSGVRRGVTSGSTSTYALTTAQSNMVFVATLGSATQTYTLPSVATAGLIYTFICGHASGEILVTPQASQAIIITTFAAVGSDADTAIVAPTAGTGVKNTAATNAIGDNLTLVSDGTQWFGLGITGGIWASQ